MGLRSDLEHFFGHALLGRRRAGGPIRYVTEGLRCRTVGLREAWAHPELVVEVSDAQLLKESARFLAWVIDYMNRRKARINAGETMLYGFWQVRWMASGRKGHLEAWDVVPETPNGYQPRADLALGYLREQLEVAARVDATLHPPPADLLFAYDDGVTAGLSVELIRRPQMNESHSGWYILSSRFSGDLRELKNEHLYHVPVWRPELVRYLGLETGWRVDLRDGERIWFEQPDPAAQQ
jgi:hypothetical protein